MRHRFKIAVLLLLLLALPAQGMASAAMLFCETTDSLGSVSGAHHSTHHHHATGDSTHTSDMRGAKPHHGVPNGHPDHGPTCSGCTSCCVGAATIPLSGNLLARSSTIQPILFDTILFSRFATDGPDRPPRSLLA
jgi:hypothetical protein